MPSSTNVSSLSSGFEIASEEKCGYEVGGHVKGEEWTGFSRRVVKGSLRPCLLYFGIGKMQGH